MKCIASDLDGTLLLEDNTMSMKTREMLKELEEKQILFLVCTGRSYMDFRSAFPTDIKVPAILLNGALYVDALGNEILSYPMQDEYIKNIEETIVNHHLSCLYFTSRGIYGSGELQGMMDCVKAYYHPDYQGEYFMEPVHIVDSYTQIHEPILKMETMCVNIAFIRQVKDELHMFEHLQVSSSLPYNIEITAKGVNKASMLQRVLSYQHLTEEDLLYFGDSNNDLEVFQEFPYTIAVHNACDEIKKEAYEICGTCEDDGVAQYIKEKVSQMA
ncbi:Cof-type HAD-IIB family hydrolase [Amedibacillus sp. YH-ame6]